MIELDLAAFAAKRLRCANSLGDENTMTQVHDSTSICNWIQSVGAAGHRLGTAIIEVRRHLHANPELSMQEFTTTRYLAERVESMGLSPQVTSQGIGLTVDWNTARSVVATKRVGLRGDIDALPILTVSASQYASQREGVMHACGHDAHAAMLWGALAILRRLDSQDELPWPVAVRGIFQPAEETSQGGPLMIEAGALDGLDCVLALHVDPTLAVGQVAGRPGPFTAACDSFDVEFTGRSGHSARPHLCADAIAAAASWISEMYARIPRSHDCRDPAVVSVGTFHGGSAANIVAGQAHLSGTIRTFSESARAAIMQEMQNVALATEKTFGCEVDVAFSSHTPSVHNNASLHATMARVASQLSEVKEVQHIELPSMGAEDFAFFAMQKPVCMMRLGIAGPVLGGHALHTPQFDLDEQAMTIGAELLAAAAIELCRPVPVGPTGEKN